MRPAAAIGQVALALALGSLVVGHAIALPLVEDRGELVDQNLGKAIGQAIALRLGLVALVACAAVAAVARRWTGSGTAATLALIATGLAGLDRLAILPRLYETWSRVDLVAGRPAERLQEAAQLSRWHDGVSLGLGLCLLALALLVARGARREDAPAPASTLQPGLRISASASPSGSATASQTVQ